MVKGKQILRNIKCQKLSIQDTLFPMFMSADAKYVKQNKKSSSYLEFEINAHTAIYKL